MTKKKGVAEWGEFGLIERIQQQAGSASFLRLGIGDDCAVQQLETEEELLTSTDMLVEGVHFNRQWTSMEQLGRKAVAVNLSDIAAMGGRPRSLFLAVALPADLLIHELDLFTRGVLEEAASFGAVLAGGDTCRSPEKLVVSVTVEGVCQRGRAIQRKGAEPDDLIFVSGTLGDSALALRQLQQGKVPGDYLACRHHTPVARVGLGLALAEKGLAKAMLDISDGLAGDLRHILKASDAGATLALERLPLSEAFLEELSREPGLIDLALSGGEDYELLFTVNPERQRDVEQLSIDLDIPLTAVGVINGGKGIEMKQEGVLYEMHGSGYDHFA